MAVTVMAKLLTAKRLYETVRLRKVGHDAPQVVATFMATVGPMRRSD
jgi:hypothetical protein